MQKLFILVFTLLSLQACAPKHAYVKTDFVGDRPTVDNIMIVIDFTSLKDDVGKLWDFDEDYNLKQQDDIYLGAKRVLENKGYTVLPNYLKSSGIFIDENYQAEHYQGGKLQESLISPPFIIRSLDISDNDINLLTQLHYELNTIISPSITYAVKNHQYSELNAKGIMSELNLVDNTAILVISANRPKVSAVKNIGIGLLSVGLSAGATGGAYIGVSTLHGIASTHGYLIHKGTGQILWTNLSARVNFKNNKNTFLELIPKAN